MLVTSILSTVLKTNIFRSHIWVRTGGTCFSLPGLLHLVLKISNSVHAAVNNTISSICGWMMFLCLYVCLCVCICTIFIHAQMHWFHTLGTDWLYSWKSWFPWLWKHEFCTPWLQLGQIWLSICHCLCLKSFPKYSEQIIARVSTVIIWVCLLTFWP